MACNVTAQSMLEMISVDHLQCSICTNRFRQPKLLDCLHSFCLQCLHELRQSQDPSATKLTCPLCRRKTILKGSGVADLPNNFPFIALVEKVTMLEKLVEGQKSNIKCQACDEENQAISRCMDCDHFLCQECQKAHERMTVMKSHKIYTLARFRSGETVDMSRLTEDISKHLKHPDQNPNNYFDACERSLGRLTLEEQPQTPVKQSPRPGRSSGKAKWEPKTELKNPSEWSLWGLTPELQAAAQQSPRPGRLYANEKWELKNEFQLIFRFLKKVSTLSSNEIMAVSPQPEIFGNGPCMYEILTAKMQQAELLFPLKLPINGLTHNIRCIAVSKDDKLLVLDGPVVKVFNKQHQLLHQFTPGRGSDSHPTCLAVDDSNLIAVGDIDMDEISLHNPDGSLIRRLPAPMIYDSLAVYNHRLIYPSYDNQMLLCVDYDGAGVFSSDINKVRGGYPIAVCCDSDGSIYVCVDFFPTEENEIQHYSPDGKYIGCVVKESGNPHDVTTTFDGDLVVVAEKYIKIYYRL